MRNGLRGVPAWLGRLCIGVVVMGSAAAAQVVPEGPGLGADRDSVILAAGQTVVRLSGAVTPRSESVVLRRDSLRRPLARGTDYALDGEDGVLRLTEPAEPGDALVVTYRARPRAPGPVTARLPVVDSDSISEVPSRPDGADADTPESKSRLQSRGSITRGVVAGTNRDATVTSGLRLDVSGEVAEDVSVEAVLTDENTPILPEGTTQQLSDFDRVAVTLTTPLGTARLGDIDLQLPGTAFAPVSRKVQGASAETVLPERGALAGGGVSVTGSATRGLFRSQEIAPVEGVQGPYRLTGAQGETFILVIPGSERVRLDGEALERGEAADYTMDYATGEITFTPAHLITETSRIAVDFEYTASRYTRSLLAADVDAALDLGGRRASVGVRVLREADASTFGDELGLTEVERDRIAAAGDEPVLVDGARLVPFDPESPAVLYVRRDTTTAAGEPATYFAPAPASADSVYQVRFSRVPPGDGSYRRAGAVRNGILYEWAGPGRGEYIPFRRLPAPSAQRVIDVRGAVEVIPGITATGEWAVSALDPNTLSPVGDADDAGGAYEATLQLAPQDLGGAWGVVEGEVRRRHRADAFRSLERVRDVSFDRRWNLSRAGRPLGGALDSLGEALTSGVLRWRRAGAEGAIEGGRLRLADLTGWRLDARASLEDPAILSTVLPSLDYRIEFASTDAGPQLRPLTGEGELLRQQGTLRRTLGAWTPGLSVEQERRAQTGADRFPGGIPTDSLLAPSYSFVAVRPGLDWSDGAQRAGVSAEVRRRAEPLTPVTAPTDLTHAATAWSVEGTGAVQPTDAWRADARAAYRRTDYVAAFEQRGRADRDALALRVSSRATPWSRALDVSTLYEALTERTPIRQETYVLVGPDLGEFVWRDGEGEPRSGEPDGVAQVDEFFPETTPLEGTYARVFVPGDALRPSIGVRGRVALRVTPSRFLDDQDAGDEGGWLSLFASRTTLEVQETSTARDFLRVLTLDPELLQQRAARVVGGDTLAPSTLQGRFRAEQEVTLFPEGPERGVRLLGRHLTTTSRRAAGLETQRVQAAEAEAFTAVGRGMTLRLNAGLDRERSVSESFSSRSYDLRGWRVEPQAVWTPGGGSRLSVSFLVSERRDGAAGPGRAARATVLRLPLEARVQAAGRFSVTARAEGNRVTLRGPALGLTQYRLTDGRGPGLSALWSAHVEVALTEVIRASVVYDGRAPSNAPSIHTVRMELSAVF